MASLGSLGIGLIFVFCFILLGVVAEIYHLVRRKKEEEDRRNNMIRRRGGGGGGGGKEGEKEREISTLFCCKNPKSVETANSLKNPHPKFPEPDLELGQNGFVDEEESVELELKRLYNLCGPPRFLFTIKEETKEDLESDERSRKTESRTRSLSDLVFAIDTPPPNSTSLAPLSSPKCTNSTYQLESYEINHGLNPLFESFSAPAADTDRPQGGSLPPSKMKFLRDAEEKFMRRLREEEEAEKRDKEEKDGSFNRIVVGKNRETEEQHQ